MAAKNSTQDIINRIRAKHRNLRFNHFHYYGRATKAVFYCRDCALYFRATPDSLLLERKDGRKTSTPCGCRLNLVSEWDLPEEYEEENDE
jgi:hypothetical protein